MKPGTQVLFKVNDELKSGFFVARYPKGEALVKFNNWKGTQLVRVPYSSLSVNGVMGGNRDS